MFHCEAKSKARVRRSRFQARGGMDLDPEGGGGFNPRIKP
jgi:hypothetical protein